MLPVGGAFITSRFTSKKRFGRLAVKGHVRLRMSAQIEVPGGVVSATPVGGDQHELVAIRDGNQGNRTRLSTFCAGRGQHYDWHAAGCAA